MDLPANSGAAGLQGGSPGLPRQLPAAPGPADPSPAGNQPQSDYAALFDAMPVPLLLLDDHGLVVEANRLAVRSFLLPHRYRDRPVSVLRLLSDEAKPTFFAAMRSQPNGHSVCAPGLAMRPLGAQQYQPFDVHFIVLPGGRAAAGYTLAVFVDRSADEARERDRLLFQAVLDNAGAEISAFDRAGRCLVANAAYLRQLGRDRHQVLGRARHELMAQAEADLELAADRALLDGSGSDVLEVQRTVDGQPRAFVTHRFPMRDARGEHFATGSVTTDITQLRATELQLQLAAEVFSRGSEAIVICNARNEIISVNAAFSELTGYGQTEAIGRNPGFLKSGRHDRSFYEAMWQQLSSTNRWEGELWNRRRNGEIYPQACRFSRVLDAEGHLTHYVGTMVDITARKAAEAEIERMAFYDDLTGAATRRLLLDRMEQRIQQAGRGSTGFLVLFVDVDHFKQINDTLGHEAGDLLLTEVAHRLRCVVRSSDTVARIGGDEFVLLVEAVPMDVAARRAQVIHAVFDEPFALGERMLVVSASVGIAHFPEDGADARSLIKNADTAMYQAKAEGRNAWRFFNAAVDLQHQRRAELGLGLRAALREGELWLAYQPQVRLSDSKLVGVEVLLRWHNEALGDPMPGEFIQMAEDSGMIVPVSDWLLGTAMQQVVDWQELGLPPIRVAVNMAASHFNRLDTPSLVRSHLARTGLAPEQLELEITEHLAMRRPDVSRRVVADLREQGVRFALDDFGTGYSSLTYLRQFPVDTVKIDRSFVQGIGRSRDDETVVTSTIALADALGKECIAEGVETVEQAGFLSERSCDVGQGYLFGPPMDPDRFWQWCRATDVRLADWPGGRPSNG